MQIVNYKQYGEQGEAIFILHGIFGMLDNWQYHAKLLSEKYRVITVDTRNHGQSFHAESMTYDEMATDIKTLAEMLHIDSFHLMGHSMGGKIAMRFAELYSSMLLSLIIVDIAPKAYPPSHLPYFKAFTELPLHTFESRTEVEDAFKPYAPDLAIRQFLLKNLEVADSGEGYQTKSYMPAIEKFYTEIIGDFALKPNIYEGKTTFIKGEKSGYIKEEDHTEILYGFPNAQFETVPKAGHWVHAENPEDFYKLLIQILN